MEAHLPLHMEQLEPLPMELLELDYPEAEPPNKEPTLLDQAISPHLEASELQDQAQLHMEPLEPPEPQLVPLMPSEVVDYLQAEPHKELHTPHHQAVN